MFSRLIFLSLLLITILLSVLIAMPALCQNSLGLSERDLLLDMQNVAKVVKSYYQKKKHLPSQHQELDELLLILYKKSSEYRPDRPLPMPTSIGTFRALGRFQATCDQSINHESNTKILWRQSSPQAWKGKAGNIGIISNGEHKFLLFAVDSSGNALRSNDHTVFFTYDLEKGDSDERLF